MKRNKFSRIKIIEADITKLAIIAIVNAANESLLGGGGVDGAIHAGAGPGLMADCRKLGGCLTGEAKITRGHSLRARYIIHTVGPVWQGGGNDEDMLLANCYNNSLKLALEKGIQSIAFPAISTGVFGFPPKRAAIIAVETIAEFLDRSYGIQKVVFCCFSATSACHHKHALVALKARH
ncbi:MAG: O-acetyl-ADP-ribose deacetylase [Magnetovibrio sp.]|nr:O-acetyl-ADP-ribose deacetylase [Magnetovibrio sp.]|tara:strand:- start:322 stop:858 length:537 start_codon:yes stop_codon:yes gene_type:complete